MESLPLCSHAPSRRACQCQHFLHQFLHHTQDRWHHRIWPRSLNQLFPWTQSSIVTVGRGGGKRKQVGGTKEGGINIYIYKDLFFSLERLCFKWKVRYPFWCFWLKLTKTQINLKNKFVAEVNTKSKIKQGLWSLTFGRKEQWYWEQSGLGLSTFLLPSFFLTTSKEVQF